MRVSSEEVKAVAEESTQGDPDWQILKRVAAGEQDAFSELVERHERRLLALCERLLQDHEAALDAAQEVFLKAYRRAGHFRPRARVFTWLYRIAVNHCLNQLRRRRLVRFVRFAETEQDETAATGEPADRSPGPDSVLETKQRWEATRRQINRLPTTQRAVLILAKFEGLTYREIATILGISESAVESRLFRAMRSLERAQESVQSRVSRCEEQG